MLIPKHELWYFKSAIVLATVPCEGNIAPYHTIDLVIIRPAHSAMAIHQILLDKRVTSDGS